MTTGDQAGGDSDPACASAGLNATETAALNMICHLVSGNATVADLRAAEAWRDDSTEHANAFARASHVWTLIGPAGQRVIAGSPSVAWRAGARLPRRHVVVAGALAASAAAVAVVADRQLGLMPSMASLMADYQTAKGRQQRIMAANGVSLQLNTDTSLDYRPSLDGIARMRLIVGEAAIVMSAGGRERVVMVAGRGQVTAQDADFVVRRDDVARCVTCVRGTIAVERGSSRVALGAGEQVNYAGAGLAEIASVDPEAVCAWQRGLLIFRGTALGAVVRELNRYRPGRIILLNDRLAQRPVNARIYLNRMDDVVALLGDEYGLHATSLPGGLVFLS
jgi:transmembrane sensor